MDILIDIIAVLLSLVGMVGCILPALPGTPLSYAALALLYFLDNPQDEITGRFMIIWLIVTAAVSILDYVLQPYFTKVTGGSPLAVRYSIAGMVAGMVFFPPLGIITGAFIGAFIAEFLVNRKPLKNSLLAALGAFLGFVSGTGLKLTASAIMLYYTIRYIF